MRLRSASERIVRNAFYEVVVNTTGAKSITLEGGSLRRKVDAVPSHWHYTANYQASTERKDRGVYVLDKHAGTRVFNLPFMHMHQINVKDLYAIRHEESYSFAQEFTKRFRLCVRNQA